MITTKCLNSPHFTVYFFNNSWRDWRLGPLGASNFVTEFRRVLRCAGDPIHRESDGSLPARSAGVPYWLHGAHQALHRQDVLYRRRQAVRELSHLRVHGRQAHVPCQCRRSTLPPRRFPQDRLPSVRRPRRRAADPRPGLPEPELETSIKLKVCRLERGWYVARTGRTRSGFRAWRCASLRCGTSLACTSTSYSVCCRVHQYVVQCALTINLFNEKLFIFVWFWYVFLALITTVNSLRWLFRSLYWPGHVQYLRKQLRAFDATQREAGILAKFAENYLRRDGMFIVRLIGMNMGEVAAGEVICGLWNNYSIERRTIAEKSGRKGVGKSRTGIAGQRVEVV